MEEYFRHAASDNWARHASILKVSRCSILSHVDLFLWFWRSAPLHGHRSLQPNQPELLTKPRSSSSDSGSKTSWTNFAPGMAFPARPPPLFCLTDRSSPSAPDILTRNLARR